MLMRNRYVSGSFQERKFESNRGVDPFSFGFNTNTQDDQYMSGEEIVIELVSIVANNGNYLLNIGPKKDGSIHEPQRRSLTDAGEWIRSHEDAIFGTHYWSTIQHSGSFRYVQKPEAFFIHHIGQPGSQVTISDPVPWVAGDVVTVVGGSQDGAVIDTSKNDDGDFVLNLTEDMVNGDKYVWTFKIAYSTE